MDRLRAMQLFQRVAEIGSFSRAGQELGISSSVASNAIKDLEAHLGVQLLRRTTRSVKVTGEGNRYLERIRVILSEIDDIEEEVKDAGRKVAGLMRLQTPVGFAHQIVAPRLPALLGEYPGLSIELLARNGLPDFVGESLDAAVFIGEIPERDLVARVMGRSPFVTCAAPDYLARHGTPATPQDLASHHTIGIRSSETGASLDWRFSRGGEVSRMPMQCRATFEASEPAVEMAASGGGILQMINYLVAPEILSGRLVPILNDWLYPGAEIAFIHPRHTRRPRRLRVLESFVVTCFREAAQTP
ncbi:LysR family transcriptional regulator [Ruegeria sediminis]|nr:LysR family transcriptional regulator [Ruegeria sediminis]